MDYRECAHDIICENGVQLCSKCYEEIDYIEVDSFVSGTNGRYYYKKKNDRGILKDIENINIPPYVKEVTNSIYLQVCNGDVHRGKFRKSIIFASIYYAYKSMNNSQSCDKMMTDLNIKKKDALKGMKYVNEYLPKGILLNYKYITTEDLIEEYLSFFLVRDATKSDILSIFKEIEDRSNLINRSRPHSVAAAVIWYWITIHKFDVGMDLKEFTKKINLSELTIHKLQKEIVKILSKN